MLSKKVLKGIRPRLVISMTLLLLFSLLFVASIIYFLLSTSLRKSDQNLLINLQQTYSQLFLEGGPTLLHNRISPEILLVIVNKSNGQRVFEQMPLWVDHDFEDEEEIRQLKEATGRLTQQKGWRNILLLSGEEDKDILEQLEYQLRLIALEKNWQTILPIIDNDLFEIYSTEINDKYWMYIGKSSETREESLSRVRYISIFVILPFLFFGLILSYFLSKKILRPINELAKTINLIKQGQTESRAVVQGSGDEIDLLTSEFNSLLDRNRVLIKNMRETIDNVAHDLRTPLTRFRSHAEYALLNKTEVSDLRSALQDGIESSDSILELLNAIMVVAEAESQIMKLNLKVITVKALIDSVADLYAHVIEEHKLHLEISAPSELLINCDSKRMIQAMGNLMDNAIKFSPEGSIIKIMSEEDQDFVTISFIDQGIGISQSDLSRIWSRLYRGDGSRTTSGLGIGLSLVKAITEAHQGSAYVTSKVGKGSCFSLRLPKCNVHVISG